MTKKEAKKWIKAFQHAKFKCICPNEVVEAFKVLGMVSETKKRGA